MANLTGMTGVSFVIPVCNGARWLDRVLSSIRAQTWSGPVEIIAIDDGSTDGSVELLAHQQRHSATLKLLESHGSGAAAAINVGVRAAAYPLIAQIDQDVVLAPGWLACLAAELDDPNVAAAQGRYGPYPRRVRVRDPWARVMSLDLAVRYRHLRSTTNHVCTGNTIYRRSALIQVGLFDEDLGYGYDNDISYRLSAAGYRLAYRADAESLHHWREGIVDYVRQQYGFGYGRLNLLTRHPTRLGGDDVSRLVMMMQGPITATALASAGIAVVSAGAGLSAVVPAMVAASLTVMLAIERFVAGLGAAVRFRDLAGLWFVPVHAVRNAAWVAAIVTWTARTALGVRPRPAHSMRPRPGAPAV